MKRISQILLINLLMFTLVFSQAPNGSKSLLHLQTGRTFDEGRFEIRSDLNFFTKLAENAANLNPASFKAANYWLVNSGLALSYGITDNFDLTVAPGIYQDTHTSNEYNLPDDIRVALKAGSFDFAERKMYGAFGIGIKFPVGEDHNYPFTYYSSGAIEYGINGALSYYVDPYLPDRSLSLHLNLGWWNHNEAGKEVWKKLTSNVNSQELQYGVGALYPTEMFDFMLELTGAHFLTQPEKFVFGREDWMYVTPTVRYKPLGWVNFNFGIDILASGSKDESVGLPVFENIGLPNYSKWKAHIGIELTILPITAGSMSSSQIQRNQFNQRVEFFQKIIEEREKSENIKEELDKLKEERESAEKELEELKQILEEEGN